jgi:hypothetical protein
VPSIAGEKEERSIYAETCSETEGEGTTSDTSVILSEQQSENTVSSDPVLWPSTNRNSPTGLIRVHLCVKKKQCSFIKSARVYIVGDKNNETRHLTLAMFKRQLSNGGVADSEWLIYSPSQGKVYCFVCNYFHILILHLTQADLMTGSMHLRPLRIMKMDRYIGNA